MQVTPEPSTATPAAGAVASSEATSGAAAAPAVKPSLVRNTMYLTLAQAVTIPISVVTNALVGRYLGAAAFGYLYLATTLCTFAVLGLEWGQQGSVPALISRDRSQAGAYLGTSLAWRCLIALPIAAVVGLICWLAGYSEGVLWAVGLSFPLSVLNSCAAGYKDAIRGFERTDIPSLAHVSQQFLGLLVVIPVLALGGHMRAFLLSHTAVALLIVLYLHRSLRPLGVARLEVRREVVRPLFSIGTPFVFFGLAMVLLPYINASFLSELVPPEVVGWYGVSQRLIGLLIFPASALIGALYPTLCRLHAEDRAEFVRVSRGSLYGVSLLAIPAAVGCGMFPELGIMIFGSQEYAGASDHLRVMSLFVFLVYFTMPLGTAIMAANRARAWTLVQCICVAVALVGNPLLVPWFQARTGNGALGTCVSLVISEALVVACGIFLSSRAVFDRGLAKSLLLASLSGGAMAVVAYFTKPFSLFFSAPLSLAAYAGVAWFSGAIDPATMDKLKGFVNRKLKRA